MSDKNGFSMEWPIAGGTEGVNVSGGRIEWWTRPDGPGGRFGESASTQAFEDFLAKGPQVQAPRKIVDLLKRHLLKP